MYQPIPEHQKWLAAAIAELDAQAGTIHIQHGADLRLSAAQNIPPPVIAIVAHVVHGKGVAGAAQLAKKPVQTCNLQDDKSGNIRPGAKAVDAQAAIAIPVLDSSENVLGVVGFAWQKEGDPAEWVTRPGFATMLETLKADLSQRQ